jgi:hypothetical protein
VAEFVDIVGIVAAFVVAVRIVVEEHTVEVEPPFGNSVIALEARIQRERKFLSADGTR